MIYWKWLKCFSDFANLEEEAAKLMYKPSTLECFKQKRSMSRYNECIEDTFIDPDEDKVYTRILWCG